MVLENKISPSFNNFFDAYLEFCLHSSETASNSEREKGTQGSEMRACTFIATNFKLRIQEQNESRQIFLSRAETFAELE